MTVFINPFEAAAMMVVLALMVAFLVWGAR